MCLPFGGCDSMITVGNCAGEMEFKMVMERVYRDHHSRLGVLVEVEAAHRSHKWAGPTT